MIDAKRPATPSPRPKVFGIGLSKSGTTSLARALDILGWRALHYPPLYELHGLLATHDAATDTSVACAFEQLDAAYPGARFVFTVREIDAWVRSAEREFKGRSVAEPWKKEVRRRLYGAEEWNRESFIAGYLAHNERVHRYFAGRSDLLVMDITRGDGWSLLCPFLHCEVPEVPFPWDNLTPPLLG